MITLALTFHTNPFATLASFRAYIVDRNRTVQQTTKDGFTGRPQFPYLGGFTYSHQHLRSLILGI